MHAAHGGLGRDPVVSVTGSLAHVGVDVPGATMMELHIGYGRHGVRGSVPGSGDLRLRLGSRASARGHLLILARDANGRVIGAFASSLPAGDSAAG